MILRIIDKQTKLFIRDDFDFAEETEIGLDVTPAQGLNKPKWNDEKWVEGLTQEEIDELTKTQLQEQTIEERLEQTEELLQSVTMAFNEILQAIGKGDMINE